jgi:Ca2+/H+ antiporter
VVLAAATRGTAARRTRRASGWSFRLRSSSLGVATVVTALVAEVLVGSLEVFAEKAACPTSSSPP